MESTGTRGFRYQGGDTGGSRAQQGSAGRLFFLTTSKRERLHFHQLDLGLFSGGCSWGLLSQTPCLLLTVQPFKGSLLAQLRPESVLMGQCLGLLQKVTRTMG